jgi:hypothetical protein
MKILTITATICLIAGISFFGNLSKTFVLKVMDESGNPTQGVTVHVKLAVSTFSNELSSGNEYKVTDSSGSISVTGNADIVDYLIQRQGYYTCKGDFSMEKNVNAHQTTLKTIDHPNAMYAKNMVTIIPSDGNTYSYDLMLGDWLPPLGHGVTPDFVFKGVAQWNSLLDYNQELQLTFTNPDDGIQAISVHNDGSALRLPKNAPVSGYVPQWTWQDADSSKQDTNSTNRTNSNRAFFFRVRSSRDNTGAIKAMYGKISHDVVFGFGEHHQGIYLKIYGYYLNPDGTTTMEFDTSKNLLVLKWPEAVAEP